jgi:predicted  nucleic acid-binding Zn-ribbon protein
MNSYDKNIEGLQTAIDMIRQESRLISYQIERLEKKRHDLQTEKARLKELITGMENG